MARYFGNDASEASRETRKHEWMRAVHRYATTIHVAASDKWRDVTISLGFFEEKNLPRFGIMDARYQSKIGNARINSI